MGGAATALALRDETGQAGVNDPHPLRPAAPAGALDMRVRAIRDVADGIKEIALVAADGGALPAFDAGAHIDLHLPGGFTRSYSLVGAPGERDVYRVAVSRDRASRGGSAYVHDGLTEGARIAVGPPRNNFPLVEDAAHSVLIAGGIGVTPIRAMVRRLAELGAPWTLHFAARTRRAAAYLADIEAEARASGGAVHVWFDDEAGGPFDLEPAVRAAPEGAHIYCCGPAAMLEAFQRVTADRPSERVHLEFFQAPEPKEGDRPLGGFVVEIASTGQTVEVPEGNTILDALMMNGIDAPYSCYEGLCGTCETRVLSGIPDHRDSLLTDKARASNETVIICCSGSRTDRLVLDL